MITLTVKSEFPVKGAHIARHSTPSEVREYSESMLARIVEISDRKTREELTVMLEQERKTAYEQGVEDGTRDTEQRHLRDLGKTFNILRKLTDTFHHELSNLIADEEQEMLKLIIAIARKVVSTEVRLNPEIVLAVLRNALNLLNDRRAIRIHVNPQDWLTVKNSLEGLDIRIELPPDVEVISSPQVATGGCLVDSASGSIDADIETQFEEIRRKLLKDEPAVS